MDKGYIVLDIETTGLNVPKTNSVQRLYEFQLERNFDEILQLAIVDQKSTTIFYESFSPVVKSTWGKAQRTHHISPKDVKDKQPFSSRKDDIQSIIKDAPMIVAYNASFDLGFLQGQGISLVDKPYICAMETFSRIYGKRRKYGGGWEWQSLETCADYYGLKNEQAHNALGDAKLTLACFKAMLSNKGFSIQRKVWK